MKCDDCNGTGYVPKHKNCGHSHPYEQFIYGCNEPIKCRRCHGFGTTGVKLVKDILLTISLESKDMKSNQLAKQALKEWE
jgi:RecJ-like exonuclease